jgi:hypothetical protein
MSFGELWRQTLQAGLEVTAGTEVAATRIMYANDITFTRERPSTAHAFATGTRSRVRATTLQAVRAGGERGISRTATRSPAPRSSTTTARTCGSCWARTVRA